jgi:hypothetical protein
MKDREVVWISLIPLALLAGLFMLLLEMAGVWPLKDIRPDFVWCIGFYAVRRSTPVSTLAGLAYSGLAYDLILGPKLGAATLAYLLTACIFLVLKDQVAGGGAVEHTVLLGLLAIIAVFLRLLLTLGGDFFTIWSYNIIVVLVSGLLTLVVYPLLYVLLSIPWLNPTREKKWIA